MRSLLLFVSGLPFYFALPLKAIIHFPFPPLIRILEPFPSAFLVVPCTPCFDASRNLLRVPPFSITSLNVVPSPWKRWRAFLYLLLLWLSPFLEKGCRSRRSFFFSPCSYVGSFRHFSSFGCSPSLPKFAFRFRFFRKGVFCAPHLSVIPSSMVRSPPLSVISVPPPWFHLTIHFFSLRTFAIIAGSLTPVFESRLFGFVCTERPDGLLFSCAPILSNDAHDFFFTS